MEHEEDEHESGDDEEMLSSKNAGFSRSGSGRQKHNPPGASSSTKNSTSSVEQNKHMSGSPFDQNVSSDNVNRGGNRSNRQNMNPNDQAPRGWGGGGDQSGRRRSRSRSGRRNNNNAGEGDEFFRGKSARPDTHVSSSRTSTFPVAGVTLLCAPKRATFLLVAATLVDNSEQATSSTQTPSS